MGTPSSYGQSVLNGEDLGQWKLREDFQEALVRPEFFPEFKARYGLDGVSELIWIRPEGELSNEKISGSIQALLSHLRYEFTRGPYRLFRFVEILKEIFQESFTRPLDALANWSQSLSSLYFPFFFSLLFLCSFHLGGWSNAIRRDFYRLFGARFTLLPAFAFTTFLFFTFYFRAFGVGLFILVFLCSLYARRNRAFFILGLVLSLTLVLKIFASSFFFHLQEEVSREALRKGRNRIEYSPDSLQSLKPVEQATWAFWNQDYYSARRILEKADDSTESRLLDIALELNPRTQADSIKSLEDLLQKGNEDPVLIFNLAQLYMLSQDLVRAEELRSKLKESDLEFLFHRASTTKRSILPIQAQTDWQHFAERIFNTSFKAFKLENETGWLSLIKQIARILLYLSPLIFILLVPVFRKHISGLCQSTGEATSSVFIPLSKLASQVQTRSTDIDHQARQKYLSYQRYYEQHQTGRLRRWSWIFPECYFLQEESVLKAFILSLSTFSILWIGLPLSIKASLTELFRFPDVKSIFETGWSWPLILIGLALHIFIFYRVRRRLT